PHWFRHRAHSKVIADPQSVDRLAPHAARGPHGSDRRLAPVGSPKRSGDRFGNRSLALPPSPLPFPPPYHDPPPPPRPPAPPPAQRLGQGLLEPPQPGHGPAREPHQLRQLEPQPRHRSLAFRPPLVQPPPRELAAHAGVHEQQPPVERDVAGRRRGALDEQR